MCLNLKRLMVLLVLLISSCKDQGRNKNNEEVFLDDSYDSYNNERDINQKNNGRD